MTMNNQRFNPTEMYIDELCDFMIIHHKFLFYFFSILLLLYSSPRDFL